MQWECFAKRSISNVWLGPDTPLQSFIASMKFNLKKKNHNSDTIQCPSLVFSYCTNINYCKQSLKMAYGLFVLCTPFLWHFCHKLQFLECRILSQYVDRNFLRMNFAKTLSFQSNPVWIQERVELTSFPI